MEKLETQRKKRRMKKRERTERRRMQALKKPLSAPTLSKIYVR
jgi:hypothetical protein